MPVTEIERTELVNRLVAVIGEEHTEILMQCILTDGIDKLATKEDLKALETSLRSEFRGEFAKLRGELTEQRGEFTEFRAENRVEFAELRAYIASTMAKQMRLYVGLLVGVMLTVWGTSLVYALA